MNKLKTLGRLMGHLGKKKAIEEACPKYEDAHYPKLKKRITTRIFEEAQTKYLRKGSSRQWVKKFLRKLSPQKDNSLNHHD